MTTAGIATRTFVAVPLTLGAQAALMTGLALHAGMTGASLLWPAAMCALGTAIAFVVLGPLRRDLRALRAHGEAPSAPGTRTHVMETEEGRALLSSAMLLQARGAELSTHDAHAREALADAELLRVRFVSAMGHDLRGPLNAILGFAELLVMDDHDAVAAAQRPAVDHIRQAATDLLALLEHILQWAKIEAGQLVLERADVALDEVLAEARQAALDRAGSRELRIDTTTATGLPRASVDRALLVQALLGLFDHAIRSAGPSALTVRRALAAGVTGATALRLELHDPSLRVRSEDHDTFFEAFRPSYEPSGRRVAGLGLGPSLARAVLRAHGGDVWFASDANSGTTFTVELPTLASPSPAP